MANQPDETKAKFTMFFHKDVLKIYKEEAEAQSKRLGRTVTMPELIRTDTLKRANDVLKRKGKKTLNLDPSAGKFANAGFATVREVVIRPRGKIEAYNKRGDLLPEWTRLEQMEQITRQFGNVKVKHAMAMERKMA